MSRSISRRFLSKVQRREGRGSNGVRAWTELAGREKERRPFLQDCAWDALWFLQLPLHLREQRGFSLLLHRWLHLFLLDLESLLLRELRLLS